ncbi:MAG: twin-arginine translocase TatA/TatE family subunit [Thermodesulfobacteriota bacterium]
MFGIGTSEILIILLIALLVLGPNEIPKIARMLGKGMREIERVKNELRDSIEFNLDEEETSKTAPAEENASAKKETKPEDKTDENELIKNPTSNSRI